MIDICGGCALFLGAHPDDIELGAGAIVPRLTAIGEVHCATLSKNRKAIELEGLLAQHRRSLSVLGVKELHVRLGDFETRLFSDRRQGVLDYMVALRRELKPTVVFVHSSRDLHQDHNVMTGEALRAFRGTTILGYEILRSSHGFVPQLLIEVSEEEVEKKILALSQYDVYQNKTYFDPNVLRAAMLRNGELGEVRYAEGFEVLRGVSRFPS